MTDKTSTRGNFHRRLVAVILNRALLIKFKCLPASTTARAVSTMILDLFYSKDALSILRHAQSTKNMKILNLLIEESVSGESSGRASL